MAKTKTQTKKVTVKKAEVKKPFIKVEPIKKKWNRPKGLKYNKKKNETPVIEASQVETPAIEAPIIEVPQENAQNETPVIEAPQNEVKTEFVENTNDESEFERFVNENKSEGEFKEDEFKEVKRETQPDPAVNHVQANQQQFAVMVNGYMLLAFVDFIAPLLVMKIGGMINPEFKKLKARHLKLTEPQKESLKEVADYMAKIIFAKLNPQTAFIMMLGFCYYENAQVALANLESEEK